MRNTLRTKIVTATAIAGLSIFGLAGCGDNEEQSEEREDTVSTEEQENENNDDGMNEDAENSEEDNGNSDDSVSNTDDDTETDGDED